MEVQHKGHQFPLRLLVARVSIGTLLFAKQAERVYRLPVHCDVVGGGLCVDGSRDAIRPNVLHFTSAAPRNLPACTTRPFASMWHISWLALSVSSARMLSQWEPGTSTARELSVPRRTTLGRFRSMTGWPETCTWDTRCSSIVILLKSTDGNNHEHTTSFPCTRPSSPLCSCIYLTVPPSPTTPAHLASPHDAEHERQLD